MVVSPRTPVDGLMAKVIKCGKKGGERREADVIERQHSWRASVSRGARVCLAAPGRPKGPPKNTPKKRGGRFIDIFGASINTYRIIGSESTVPKMLPIL